MVDLEVLEAPRQADESLKDISSRFKAHWPDVSFVAAWELQSQISSVVLISFARFAHVWETIPVMLVWSLTTTMVFHHARLKGRPDLLERVRWGTESKRLRIRMLSTLWTAFRAWIAGVQAFIFARIFGVLLQKRTQCWRQSCARVGVLGLGLTVFGVPTAHHILRKAGYERGALLRRACFAAFLNVPYRVLVSAFLINAAIGLIHPAINVATAALYS